jgi:hypothetical protein
MEQVCVLAAMLAVGGCYDGRGSVDSLGPGLGDGADGAGDGDGDGGDGPVAGLCGEPQTGPTALRRLTNDQYDRTVDDLLGIETWFAESFSPDERIGTFKSNGAAPVGQLQVEQYMDAAESLAAEAAADLGTLLPCDPGAMGEDTCADEFVRAFGLRAYRRPLTDAEVAAVMAVYAEGKAEGGFGDGIRIALQGMLQSPHFLYHVETGLDPEAAEPGKPVALTGYEVASRLSYFLWNTMPDDELFAAAEAGDLMTAEGIEAQVDRMLADDKAREAIASFHLQWLGVDEIASLEKNGTAYPSFSPELALAMRAETADFAKWVMTEGDGKLSTLLTADFTVTEDPQLLALYGATLPAGHVAGEPVPLDPTQRAGLLTHASLLAEHAHADQSSPVHRGQLVRENFLCTPLPPPPPDVDNVPPDPTPGATTRERFAQHTSDPACAGCHVLIDGLGFGFESYDAIGAFRELDEGLPVDASGEVVGTEDIDGTFDGAVELASILASSEQVSACVAQQWFRFALGRLETDDDGCAFDHMTEAFGSSDQDLKALVKTIAVSDSFRFRRVEEDA